MDVRYDKKIDAMYIKLEEGEYEVSEELGNGIMIDFSKDGKVIGIEVLDASEKISQNHLKNMIIERQ